MPAVDRACCGSAPTSCCGATTCPTRRDRRGRRARSLSTDESPAFVNGLLARLLEVMLDVKMPVLDGISAAERIAAARIAPVVMLTAFSQRELVERARDAGAMAYLVKPFTQGDLVPAIELAVSRYAEISTLEAEVADLGERLETRKRVERAKALLQQKYALTEPDAFRWLQKSAMDRRLSMREVADVVIREVGES
jgi:AmiR/NasT family two-component response regulator